MAEYDIDAAMVSYLAEFSEEELLDFTKLENPTNAKQVGLYTYCLFLAAKRTGNAEIFEVAIQLIESWAVLTSAHPDYCRCNDILSKVTSWYDQDKEFQEAISVRLLANCSNREGAAPKRGVQSDGLYSQAMELKEKIDKTGCLEDLNKAIEFMETAIYLAGDYIKLSLQLNLGELLYRRSVQTKSTADLDRAISSTSNVIKIMPNGGSTYVYVLINFAGYLQKRFEQTGLIDDLKRAVGAASDAVNAAPRSSPDYTTFLCNFGGLLKNLFDHTGLIDDLNRAIGAASEVVDNTSLDSPHRADRLSSLGSMLSDRFERTESMDDLHQTIKCLREAVGASPRDHGHEHDCPNYAIILGNLSASLRQRFDLTGSMDDLHQSINAANDALDASPLDNECYPYLLNNLGNSLFARCVETDSTKDLERAISLSNVALDATPHDNAHRAYFMDGLSRKLRRQYEKTGSIEVLDRAISLASNVLDITPCDHLHRGRYLDVLGGLLGNRFMLAESRDDLQRQVSCCIEGWHCNNSPPNRRIDSARKAARILITLQRWEESSQLLHDAILLLPKANPRSLRLSDTQALRKLNYDLGSVAAAAALNAGKSPEEALQLLELGRGVMAGQLMDIRGDVTDLKLKHPELAEKFVFLRDKLDSPAQNATSLLPFDKMASRELQMKQRREADREFNDIVKTIRAQPDFSSFLLPPTAEDMKKAAEHGPVIVINSTSWRSDAFVITRDSIRVVKLPDLIEEAMYRLPDNLVDRSKLPALLEWLWHQFCHPILDALNYKNPIVNDNWPHVYWIPTGFLTLMPLHAAGIYNQISKETVLDRVISSYASSIKALLHGRRYSIQNPIISSPKDSAIIVAMQETPGLQEGGHLQYAVNEVEILKDICPQLQLTPIMPPRRKNEIIRHLSTCKLFHFAGHGKVDLSEPSQSCLLLEDWQSSPLTVGEIRDHRLQDDPPFLAYLSACSTGVNFDIKLLDEGVNLINGFQLAGFRHVVGTMWEVSDKHCVDVARILYETLRDEGMTDKAVSRGLHRALRTLRDGRKVYDNMRDAELVSSETSARCMTEFSWVPYVHFGV